MGSRAEFKACRSLQSTYPQRPPSGKGTPPLAQSSGPFDPITSPGNRVLPFRDLVLRSLARGGKSHVPKFVPATEYLLMPHCS